MYGGAAGIPVPCHVLRERGEENGMIVTESVAADEEELANYEYQRQDSTWYLEVGQRVYREEQYQAITDGNILYEMYANGEINFFELPLWAQEAEIAASESRAGWDPNP
jgi:hypothetical protein